MSSPPFIPDVFVVAVDGVMTDGTFVYSDQGKLFKIFGADDADGLELIRRYVPVRLVTADKRGLAISRKRIVEDMGLPLDLVSARQRAQWIASIADPARAIYMGDGFYDCLTFAAVGYSIAPANALEITKGKADFVTTRRGGDRAVAQACLHLMDVFFGGTAHIFDPQADGAV